jgi:quinol monooxygenase YgiN
MNTKQLLLISAALLLAVDARAEETQKPYVQVAELDIEPAQLEAYKAAVTEHAATAIRAEPGVLVLYAVAEKDNPTRIRVFEVYADTSAYKAHLEAPHFKKYKAVTEKMVKSLKLVQTNPIAMAAKDREK